VLEGVAYGLRDSLELLRELGVQPNVGRISGGGARSPLWRQIVASVLAIPLEKTAAEEGSAYGAALLAGCASGAFAGPQDAVERCVRVHGQTNPDPAWVGVYADGYARFQELYPALAPLAEHPSV
jgi:xylulokinase